MAKQSSQMSDASEMEDVYCWNVESTRALIGHCDEHYDVFHSSALTKKLSWEYIASLMQSTGFTVTGVECQRQWKFLHKMFLDSVGTTGATNRTNFEYFNEMQQLVKNHKQSTGVVQQTCAGTDFNSVVKETNDVICPSKQDGSSVWPMESLSAATVDLDLDCIRDEIRLLQMRIKAMSVHKDLLVKQLNEAIECEQRLHVKLNERLDTQMSIIKEREIGTNQLKKMSCDDLNNLKSARDLRILNQSNACNEERNNLLSEVDVLAVCDDKVPVNQINVKHTTRSSVNDKRNNLSEHVARRNVNITRALRNSKNRDLGNSKSLVVLRPRTKKKVSLNGVDLDSSDLPIKKKLVPLTCYVCRKRIEDENYVHVGAKTVCSACDQRFPGCTRSRTIEDAAWKNPYFCTMCNKTFLAQLHALRHARIHLSGDLQLCVTCGKSFATRDLLKNHTAHCENRKHRCTLCPRTFSMPFQLRDHMIWHSGKLDYICTVCGKGFAFKIGLTIHMRLHTGNRPYQCEYCPKNFHMQGHLMTHITSHTGEKKILCKICSKGFRLHNVLRKHMNMHARKGEYLLEPTPL